MSVRWWLTVTVGGAMLLSCPLSTASAQNVSRICGACQVNPYFYGHYPTRWRPWPEESRPDIHFPQSLGAEPVKRPIGEPRPELPKETLEPVIPRPQEPISQPAQAEPLSPQPPAIPEPEASPATIPPTVPPAAIPPIIPPAGTAPAMPGLPSSTQTAPLPGPLNSPGRSAAPVPPSSEPSPFQAEPAGPRSAPQLGPTVPSGAPPRQPAAPQGQPSTPGSSASGQPITGVQWSLGNAAIAIPNTTSSTANHMPDLQASRLAITDPTGLGPDNPSARTPGKTVAPLIVTNQTLGISADGREKGIPSTAAPASKWDIPRAEPVPDVAQVPWVPRSPSSTVPQVSLSQMKPAKGPAPKVVNPTAMAGDEQPGAVTVWDGDSLHQTVTPATYAAPGNSRKPASTSSTTKSASRSGDASQATAHSVADTPAFGGYCPVELLENEDWVKGEARFAVEYGGQTYFCAGATQKRRFQTNPERYAPVCNGQDPVLLVDQRTRVDGVIEHCVVYDGRLYVFSGVTSLARFRANPQYYARAVTQFRQ